MVFFRRGAEGGVGSFEAVGCEFVRVCLERAVEAGIAVVACEFIPRNQTRPVEPVDDLVDVCAKACWEVVGVLVKSRGGGLAKFPGVLDDAGVVEVVTGPGRAFLTASKVKYPRVRSFWMKRRVSRIRKIRKF